MSEYLTLADLTNRLTEAGIRYVADRNRDGVVNPAESASYLDSALQYAGNIIDGYLSGRLNPARARVAGNAWLRDRAVDLAAWRAAGHGGRPVPQSLTEARDLALAQLQRVREGDRIPGLEESSPANARCVTKTPKIANLARNPFRIP